MPEKGGDFLMTTEQKIAPLMDQVVKIIRAEYFVPEYRKEATVEECVGLAVSTYFSWDSRIFLTFYEALEDANFHTEAEEVRLLTERVNKRYTKSSFRKGGL
jgi:hypothetical protein